MYSFNKVAPMTQHSFAVSMKILIPIILVIGLFFGQLSSGRAVPPSYVHLSVQSINHTKDPHILRSAAPVQTEIKLQHNTNIEHADLRAMSARLSMEDLRGISN